MGLRSSQPATGKKAGSSFERAPTPLNKTATFAGTSMDATLASIAPPHASAVSMGAPAASARPSLAVAAPPEGET